MAAAAAARAFAVAAPAAAAPAPADPVLVTAPLLLLLLLEADAADTVLLAFELLVAFDARLELAACDSEPLVRPPSAVGSRDEGEDRGAREEEEAEADAELDPDADDAPTEALRPDAVFCA